MTAPLLTLDKVCKRFLVRKNFFGSGRRWLTAVDQVSLVVHQGETLGLVGESGCGKSTVGNLIVHLLTPDSGEIIFDGRNISTLSGQALRAARAKMQIVFQDPYSSLDPRMSVGAIVALPLRVAGLYQGTLLRERVISALAEVGLGEDSLERYPHEFSGGQRQRIALARALAVQPAFVVLDEPTSALDVSVQAQILQLMAELQARHGLAYLFISHNLNVVRHVSQRTAVMYLGAVVETGSTEDLFTSPAHPYTQALLASVPVADPRQRQNLARLKGDVPSPLDLPPGCGFHPRCPLAFDLCTKEAPQWVRIAPGHEVACHLHQ